MLWKSPSRIHSVTRIENSVLAHNKKNNEIPTFHKASFICYDDSWPVRLMKNRKHNRTNHDNFTELATFHAHGKNICMCNKLSEKPQCFIHKLIEKSPWSLKCYGKGQKKAFGVNMIAIMGSRFKVLSKAFSRRYVDKIHPNAFSIQVCAMCTRIFQQCIESGPILAKSVIFPAFFIASHIGHIVARACFRFKHK